MFNGTQRLTSAQMTTIKNEMQTDPNSLGYAPFITVNDVINLALLLNFLRDGATACPVNNVVGAAITTYANAAKVRNTSVSTQQILGAIAQADLITTGTTAFWALFQSLMNDGAVLLTNPDGTENNNAVTIKQAVTAGSGSRTAIVALENRNGSRAEQLLNLSGATGLQIFNGDQFTFSNILDEFDIQAAFLGHY